MGIFQSFILAIKSLLNNKMRAFLTMLGIIIGVGSVILIMSLGNGVTSEVSETFESMGLQTVSVTISGRGSNRSFTDEDMYAFVSDYPEIISAMTPTVNVSASAKPSGWNETLSTKITGVGEDWLTVKTYKTDTGRFLSYTDMINRNKVCFVGAYFNSADVFGGSAVGSKIKIGGDLYTIVGVAEEISDKNDDEGSDNFIVIPYTVAARLSRVGKVNSFTILAASEDVVSAVKQATVNRLYSVFEDENAYYVTAMSEMAESVTEIMDTLVLVIACIAGISLLVGGIGIMNIMLVSVTERTREIGIRKALGAKKRDVKLQFVIEAMTTSLIGGIFGIIFGTVGANFAAKLLDMPAAVSVNSVAISVGISVGIGVLFGYLPAKKAADLNPIDALRHE